MRLRLPMPSLRVQISLEKRPAMQAFGASAVSKLLRPAKHPLVGVRLFRDSCAPYNYYVPQPAPLSDLNFCILFVIILTPN